MSVCLAVTAGVIIQIKELGRGGAMDQMLHAITQNLQSSLSSQRRTCGFYFYFVFTTSELQLNYLVWLAFFLCFPAQ